MWEADYNSRCIVIFLYETLVNNLSRDSYFMLSFLLFLLLAKVLYQDYHMDWLVDFNLASHLVHSFVVISSIFFYFSTIFLNAHTGIYESLLMLL